MSEDAKPVQFAWVDLATMRVVSEPLTGTAADVPRWVNEAATQEAEPTFPAVEWFDARVVEAHDEVKRKLAGIDCEVRTFVDPSHGMCGAVGVVVTSSRVGYDGAQMRVTGSVTLWKDKQETTQEMQRETHKIARLFTKRLEDMR